MSNPQSPDKSPDSWLGRIKVALGLVEAGSIRGDLEDALQEPDEAKEFSPKERSILINVLGMRDVRVSDVMTPRSQILGVSETASLAEVFEVFRSTSHARLPVYRETLDDPKGMIHIRDFVAHFAGEGGAGLVEGAPKHSQLSLAKANLLRPVLFVPPSTPALDLLVRMQSKRVHMAIIIDEYGETDGLVTMEDLVEVIVGNIEDEHDTPDDTPMLEQKDGSFIVSAAAGLEEVAEALGVSLEVDDANINVDSIGGLVTALAGRVPQTGETVEGPAGVMFEILEAVPRRVKKLSIRRPDTHSEAASSLHD